MSKRKSYKGRMVQIACVQCGKPHLVRKCLIGYQGRNPKFCSLRCSGNARRLDRSTTEKKEIKRLYDLEYRNKNREILKAKRAAWFQKDYAANPGKYKASREAKKDAHREYLKTYTARPEWKKHKQEYDRVFRAKRLFGPLWESHVLTVALDKEIKSRMSVYEIRLKNGTLNKALMRSRNGEVKRSYT